MTTELKGLGYITEALNNIGRSIYDVAVASNSIAEAIDRRTDLEKKKHALEIAKFENTWSKDNEEPEQRDDMPVQVVIDMLNMVSVDATLHEVENWTPEQRLLAFDWGQAVHFEASDNIIDVPTKPEFLR